METKKRALGRGLEQLFNNENLDLQSFEKHVYETTNKEEIIEINLSELRPNPYQPRKVFNEEALVDLANSIKEHGVFLPIIVKKSIKKCKRIKIFNNCVIYEKIRYIFFCFWDRNWFYVSLRHSYSWFKTDI